MTDDLDHIISGCINNDRTSQNRLYRAYYSYGMSVAIRYVRDKNEAQIILNDGFMKVFNHLSKFDADKAFKPWLRKIIVNTALSHMKKHHKDRLVFSSHLGKEDHGFTKNEVLNKIGFEELLNIVKTLSTAYRTVFNMYVIDGYKHEEIAQKLGISVGTSKSNLSKARTLLKQKVAHQLAIDHAS